MNNPVAFHRRWLGLPLPRDLILKVDPLNPALSARLATAFESWRLQRSGREMARAQLAAFRRLACRETRSTSSAELWPIRSEILIFKIAGESGPARWLSLTAD
jgi:hypothetical protein